MPKGKRIGRVEVLRKIFTSPFYIFLTIAAAVAYYWVFAYFIDVSNKGLFFVTVPIYTIYALVLSAAVMLSTSAYALHQSLKAKYSSAGGGTLSAITSIGGSLIVSCSCSAPILSSVLYAIGASSLQVGVAISFLGYYQLWLVILLIVVNLIFIYYQLGRITRIGGVHRR